MPRAKWLRIVLVGLLVIVVIVAIRLHVAG
jgi:hypothetical protein